jgi:hypothetical protein
MHMYYMMQLIHRHTHKRTHTYLYTQTYILHTHIPVCSHTIHTHASRRTHAHTYVHTRTHDRTHTHRHAHTYIHVHTYTYVFPHLHLISARTTEEMVAKRRTVWCGTSRAHSNHTCKYESTHTYIQIRIQTRAIHANTNAYTRTCIHTQRRK